MIPQKIHYCWLSEEAFPEEIEKCINSWRNLLIGYDFIKWDLKKFPLEKSIWVKQAYESRKYAFAADYIRLYALYTEGGIYLDCDVEVLKTFDSLLSMPYFVSKENSPQGIEAATIGAEKGCFWIGKCLEYYDNKKFITEDGNMQTEVLPVILQNIISSNYELKNIKAIEEFSTGNRTVCVLPTDYFSPKNYVTKKIITTDNTFSIHHFAGTWQPKWKKALLRIWIPLKVRFPNFTRFLKQYIIH